VEALEVMDTVRGADGEAVFVVVVEVDEYTATEFEAVCSVGDASTDELPAGLEDAHGEPDGRVVTDSEMEGVLEVGLPLAVRLAPTLSLELMLAVKL
jgi:hypothetical protein